MMKKIKKDRKEERKKKRRSKGEKTAIREEQEKVKDTSETLSAEREKGVRTKSETQIIRFKKSMFYIKLSWQPNTAYSVASEEK